MFKEFLLWYFNQQNIQMCTVIQSINYTFVRCRSILLLLLKIEQNLFIKPYTLRYFSAQFMAQRSSLFRTCHIITDYIYSHTFWNRSNICYIQLDHAKWFQKSKHISRVEHYFSVCQRQQLRNTARTFTQYFFFAST